MIGKLGEIIRYVENMAKQVAFYRDVLGFRVIDPADTNPCDAFWVLFDTGSCQLALHGGGARRFGEDAPKFVFMVEDIESARAALFGKGVAVDEVFSPIPGVSVVNCTDPEENRFSLESRHTA